MPYPNEHAARVKDPGAFQADSFRRMKLEGSHVVAIIGRPKGSNKTETQSYRFPTQYFTVAQAQAWLKENKLKPIKFEAATGESKAYEFETVITRPCPEPRLEAKIAEGTNGKITGYASVWDVTDRDGDIVRRGTFSKSIQERVAAGKVPLMAKHFRYGGATGEAIGVITKAKEDDHGLYFEAELYEAQLAQETRGKVMKSPAVFGASVGYMLTKGGVKKIKGGREITEAKLFEVTITPIPSNQYTTVAAKSDDVIDGILARLDALEGKAENQPEESEDGDLQSPVVRSYGPEIARQRRLLSLLEVNQNG